MSHSSKKKEMGAKKQRGGGCKRAEETLRESEAAYRSLFEDSLLAISQAAPDGRLIRANMTYARMYGYESPEQIIADIKTIRQRYVHPKDRKEVLRILNEKGFMEPREFQLFRRDGTQFTALVSARAVKDPNGKLLYYQATHVDITEQKRAQAALWERDIQFKKLLSWVPGMIYQFTKKPDGTYCVPFTTDAIESIFGCTPQEVREDFSPITRVILPEDLDKVIGSIEYSAEHLTIWTCEYRVQIPGQSIKWVFGKSTPEKLADGRITWHGFNNDATERKQAENALAESKALLSSIIDSTHDLIWSVDADRFSLLTFNSELEVFFKKAAIRIREGMLLEEILPRELADKLSRLFSRALREGSLITEYQTTIGNRALLIHAHVLERGRKAYAISIFGQDITDRKRAEEALRKSESDLRALAMELSRAEERERQRLAACLHDEIGQSLALVRLKLGSLAAAMKSRSDKQSIKALRDVLETVIGQTHELIFDLSPPVLHQLGLAAAIEWAGEKIGRDYGLDFSFEDDGVAKSLSSDLQAILFRCIRELMLNTAKHAKVRRLTVAIGRMDETIIITVADDGIGFDALRQSARLENGGYGLFSIQEHVAMIGGACRIQSAPGQGTCITLTVPAADGTPRENEADGQKTL